MPEKETLRRAEKDRKEGKAATTQAGEFVREEMHHIREGKHGARNTKQAIAIGLSKARRSGVKLDAPAKGKASDKTRQQAKRDLKKAGTAKKSSTSSKRSAASTRALKREGKAAASKKSVSKQAKSAARKRPAAARSTAAKKAARTRKRATSSK